MLAQGDVLGADNSGLAEDPDPMESSSPAVSSFKGLISKQKEEETIPIITSQTNAEQLTATTAQVKDAWLTPDITVSIAKYCV